MKTYLLYALEKGEPKRHMEHLLVSYPISASEAERVIEIAKKDGWHGFRLHAYDEAPPNFEKTLNKEIFQ